MRNACLDCYPEIMSDLDDIIAAYPDSEQPGDTIVEPSDSSAGETGGQLQQPGREVSTPIKTKYDLSGEVSRGGMGIILSARDTGIGRDVAMKVILSGWQESREFYERFIREAQVQGRLEHPNICPVHELGADDEDRPYFTMKMVHGYSLADMIKQAREKAGARDSKRLTEILNIFLKICDGMAYAHSQGIIHRDLKPDNIMVGDFGEVYVMDWGLAKILGAEEDNFQNGLVIDDQPGPHDTMKTMTGSVIGTPSYMPPEQAKGLVELMDERSDIYSLGALLYELLALRAPFDGDDAWEVLSRIPKQIPPPPSANEAAMDISPELDSIIMKCLSKNKLDRYQSVQKLKEEIELFLSGRPVGAMEYSLWQVAVKWISRNRALAFSTLAVLLVIIAAASVAYVNMSEAWKNEQFARLKAEENARMARTALAEADARRRQAEISDIKSRINMAMMLQEKGEIGEAVTQYRLIRKDLLKKRLDIFPYVDLAIWKAQYNDGHSVRLQSVSGNERSSSQHLAYSPDGQTLAMSAGNGTINVWDRAAGKFSGSLQGSAAAVSSLTFSPDGQTLAAGYRNGDVIIYDLSLEHEPADLKDPDLGRGSAHDRAVRGLAFNPGGTLLASSGDTVIRLWDVQKCAVKTRLSAHVENVMTVEFSPDGKYLVSGSQDKHVGLWDVDSGSLTKILYQHKDQVNEALFTPDGTMVVSASNDTTIKLWDLQKDRETASLRGHETDVKALAVSPGGKMLVTGGRDGTVRFWDLERQVILAVFREHRHPVTSVAFSPDGREAASTGSGGAIRFWSLDKEDLVRTIDLSSSSYKICNLTFSPDGTVLAVGPESKSFVPVLLIDPANGDITHRLMSHGGKVSSVAFSPDGRLLATGSGDGVLRTIDLKTQEQLAMIDVRTEETIDKISLLMSMAQLFNKDADEIWKNVKGVAFSPDGRHLATACEDGTLKLWDTGSWQCLHTFLKGAGDVVTVDFSPDGRLLAVSGERPQIRLYEVSSRKFVGTLAGHTSKVRSVTFSPDSKRLASASDDRGIRVWNIQKQTCDLVLHGHFDGVNDVAFSPDGRLLASAGSGSTVKIWDLTRKECILTLKEHGNDVRSVEFSPDGTVLASGSRDRSIKLWQFGEALKPLEF